MKYIIGVVFITCIASVVSGYILDVPYSQKLIGFGVLGFFFIVVPLFSWYRWKDRNVQEYMLNKENLDKMRAREGDTRSSKLLKKTKEIILFEVLNETMHVHVSATIDKNNNLKIEEFDGSKKANEIFGGDVEKSLIIDNENKKLLIKKLSLKDVITDLELLDWLKTNYSEINALSHIKELYETYKLSFKYDVWP